MSKYSITADSTRNNKRSNITQQFGWSRSLLTLKMRSIVQKLCAASTIKEFAAFSDDLKSRTVARDTPRSGSFAA